MDAIDIKASAKAIVHGLDKVGYERLKEEVRRELLAKQEAVTFTKADLDTIIATRSGAPAGTDLSKLTRIDSMPFIP